MAEKGCPGTAFLSHGVSLKKGYHTCQQSRYFSVMEEGLCEVAKKMGELVGMKGLRRQRPSEVSVPVLSD